MDFVTRRLDHKFFLTCGRGDSPESLSEQGLGPPLTHTARWRTHGSETFAHVRVNNFPWWPAAARAVTAQPWPAHSVALAITCVLSCGCAGETGPAVRDAGSFRAFSWRLAEKTALSLRRTALTAATGAEVPSARSSAAPGRRQAACQPEPMCGLSFARR